MFFNFRGLPKKMLKQRERVFRPQKSFDGEINIQKLPKFTFLPNWRVEDLRGEIDLFVNYISFQEMEPHIVRNYAKEVMRLNPKFILLRNLREGKQKRNGEKWESSSQLLKKIICLSLEIMSFCLVISILLVIRRLIISIQNYFS